MSKRNIYIDQLQGYKEALKDYKINFKKEYVIISNLSQEDGVRTAARIKQMNPLPDGIFVANDNGAIGCMLAMKASGIRIQEDIAFVGFNNDPVSKVIEPNLSTINYLGYEMGQAAARNLMNHLNGVTDISTTNTIILRSELIIRASSQHSVSEP